MWYNIGINMVRKRHMLRRTHARVRYSAAYPTGRERMLEPRYGCARAPLIGIRFADGLSTGEYAGVGLPERSEPGGPQGAARERMLEHQCRCAEECFVFGREPLEV